MTGPGSSGARRPRAGMYEAPDLGDLVIILLASTLSGLRDRLGADGYESHADLVADLVEIVDDYIIRTSS